MVSKGGAFSINNEKEAIGLIGQLIDYNEKLHVSGSVARDYVMNNIGATEKTVNMIKKYMG